MKSLLRKFPVVFNTLRLIKRRIIIPIRCGYAIGFPYYRLRIKKNEVARLKALGFVDLMEFRPITWRYGKGKDRAFRRYYKGKFEGKEFFVKVATNNDTTVVNEVLIQQNIRNYALPFTPKNLISMTSFSDQTVMLANAYNPGLERFTCPKSIEEMEELCQQFLLILDQLNSIGLVHADIHAGNLMRDSNGKLVIVDFGISRFINQENNVNYVARPGTYYRRNNTGRRYDDAYSFLCLLERLGVPNEWKSATAYQQIKNLVDRCCFDVSIPLSGDERV